MSTSTSIDWQNHNVKRWSALVDALPRSALEQTWAFAEAVRLHARRPFKRGIITHNGQDVGLFQLQERPIGPMRFWLLARGPNFIADTPPEVIAQAHADIRAAFSIKNGDFLLWMPEKPDSPQSKAEMAALGMRKLVTGYHSAWMDVSKPPHVLRQTFHKSWNKNLKLAEKSPLKTHVHHTGKTLTWLLTQADAHRKDHKYRGTSGAFAHLIAGLTPNKGDVLTFIATQNDTPVAGMLFLRHGKAATYYIGWNGEEGRKSHAHHLLMWTAIQDLHQRGVIWMDLGGISTDEMPGVANFKLGINPDVYSLAGLFG